MAFGVVIPGRHKPPPQTIYVSSVVPPRWGELVEMRKMEEAYAKEQDRKAIWVDFTVRTMFPWRRRKR